MGDYTLLRTWVFLAQLKRHLIANTTPLFIPIMLLLDLWAELAKRARAQRSGRLSANPRRFYYLSDSLRDRKGHHLELAQSIVQGVAAQGWPIQLFTHRDIHHDIVRDLSPFGTVSGVFPIHAYDQTSADVLIAGLASFSDKTRVYRQVLEAALRAHREDIVLIDTAFPHAIAAAALWAQEHFAPADCPYIIFHLLERHGAAVSIDQEGVLQKLWLDTPVITGLSDQHTRSETAATFSPVDQYFKQIGLSPVYFRYAASLVGPAYTHRIRFAIPDQWEFKHAYQIVLDRDIASLPHPMRIPVQGTRNHPGQGALRTVAFIGYQRLGKGTEHLPEVISLLLTQRVDVQFIVHDSSGTTRFTQWLEPIAKTYPQRLETLDRQLSPDEWDDLLQRCDIIAAPYDRKTYAAIVSGSDIEALRNGLPLITVSHTASLLMHKHYGMPAIYVEDMNTQNFAQAIDQALDQYDALHRQSQAAACLWRESNGPENWVQALFRLCPPGTE